MLSNVLIYYHEHHLILKEISFVRGCRIHVQPQIYNFASFDVPCVQYNDIAYYPCNENLNKFSFGSKVLSLIFLLMLLLIGVKANGLIAGCNLLYKHRSSSNEQKRERWNWFEFCLASEHLTFLKYETSLEHIFLINILLTNEGWFALEQYMIINTSCTFIHQHTDMLKNIHKKNQIKIQGAHNKV